MVQPVFQRCRQLHQRKWRVHVHREAVVWGLHGGDRWSCGDGSRSQPRVTSETASKPPPRACRVIFLECTTTFWSLGPSAGCDRCKLYQHPRDEDAVSPGGGTRFFQTSFSRELQNGTPVFDSNNNELGYSRRAARKGILQVIVSRIFMPIPALGEIEGLSRIRTKILVSGLTPVLMNHLDKKGILGKYPWISLPTNVGIVGLFVVIVNPLACAFFKQKARMEVDKLEPEVRASVVEKFSGAPPDYVYFNKGL